MTSTDPERNVSVDESAGPPAPDKFDLLYGNLGPPSPVDAVLDTPVNGGRIICIEGNIAAGKTTLFNALKAIYEARGPGGRPMLFIGETIHKKLTTFYEPSDNGDEASIAETIQTDMFQSRLLSYNNAIEAKRQGTCVVIDRSLYADMLFERAVYHQGDISESYHARYIKGAREAVTSHCLPDGVVYLNTPVQECMRRIAERGREGEEWVTPRYLDALYQQHGWLMHAFPTQGVQVYEISPGDERVAEAIMKSIDSS